MKTKSLLGSPSARQAGEVRPSLVAPLRRGSDRPLCPYCSSLHLGILLLVLLAVASCSKKSTPLLTERFDYIEKPLKDLPKYEFRGAWVATVANIDWPSKKGLPAEEQKTEFDQLSRKLQSQGMNALFVQVRAATDAFYAKSTEPWSEWLTGTQGKAPEPFYDPLDYMITCTHEQGMEFHAWLNLNRGKHKKATSIASDHLIHTRPDWFLTYDGYTLFNFGLPEVRTYIIDITLQIVKNYPIDGIHFDDYFYPYKVSGEVFPDAETFKKNSRGFSDIEDWRRDNINLIIKELHQQIKAEKPWIKFGISPFGVWRNTDKDPTGSETKGGQPSYDDLYADTRLWAEKGWIDYIVPQIYFPFEHKLVPYATLTDWWAANHGQAQLYIGHGLYRVDGESDTKAWQDPYQLPRQLSYNRTNAQIQGSVFFSANGFMKNHLQVADAIKSHFKYPALPPPIDFKSNKLSSPEIFLKKTGAHLEASWIPQPHSRYVLYHFNKGETINLSDPRHILAITGKDHLVLNEQIQGGVLVLQQINAQLEICKPSFLSW